MTGDGNTTVDTPNQSDEQSMPTPVNELPNININSDLIDKVRKDPDIIKFMRAQFKKMSKPAAINLITLLLHQKGDIRVKDINHKFSKFLNENMGKFENAEYDENRLLNKNIQASLYEKLVNVINKLHIKGIEEYEEDKHHGIHYIENEDVYVISKNNGYDKFRKVIAEQNGEVVFKYDFEKPDMKPRPPRNTRLLQRSKIQILSEGVKFGYPISYNYYCPQCQNHQDFAAYLMASTGGRYRCEGMREYVKSDGTIGFKPCNMMLKPDDETSPTVDAYYHEAAYHDENGKEQITAVISFVCYQPGFYDSVFFKLNNPKKTDIYHLVDVKLVESEVLELPEQNPKENYIFTLQRMFDDYIFDKTMMKIYGLLPIKIALILQAMGSYLGFELNNNIQIMGDASCGKSTVLKYYGYMLYNYRHLTSNGQSMSIPGLRGTRETINLLGKDTKIVTIGHLGTFRSIHIDEITDNEELVKSMKSFLVEANYSYNKAGATFATRTRTAQVSISGNLDHAHVGQYRGSVKKAYREFTSKIGDHEKPDWDETWDLHMPLYKYADNPYLMKILTDKRNEFFHKRVWWIDGFEIALHERFPFYFYVVMNEMSDDFNAIIRGNTSIKPIKENMELIRALRNDNLINFFESFMKFRESRFDDEAFIKADEIIESYGIHADSRMKEFYFSILQMSRIINSRLEYKDMDFDLLKWMIEVTNCKVDFNDITEFKIQGPPDIELVKQKQKEIEESTHDEDDEFGIMGEMI